MMEGPTQAAQEMVPKGLKPLPKTPTGTPALDDVTEGRLTSGRPTLVRGPAGCGKTPS